MALGAADINRILAAKLAKKFPYKEYGRTVVKRGTPMSLSRFGPTYRTATADQKQLRHDTGFVGRGAYLGKYYGAQAGRNLALAIEMPELAPLGAIVGGKLGNAGENYLIDQLTPHLPESLQHIAHAYRGTGLYQGRVGYGGHGLYSGSDAMHSNNLVTGASAAHLRNSIPHMSGSVDETGAVRVCHREYLSDVYAPGVAGSGVATAFQNSSYAINPALQQTFSFLSQIAQNYDEYEFKKLIFHYRSTTTDIGNSTTGQCGTVILCTNYNAAAPPFTDKQSMLEYAHAHDCKVTESMTHGVECDPKKVSLSNKLFTRANPVVTGQDLKTYDHGLFQIALANLPSAYNGLPVGELWVEYDVILRKPKLFTSRGLEIDQDLFTVAASGTGTLANPLGTATAGVLIGQQNNIGCSVTIGTGTVTITFPAYYSGALEILLAASSNVAFTGVVSAAYVGSTTGNLTPIYDLYDGTLSGTGSAYEGDPSYIMAIPNPATGMTTTAVPGAWQTLVHYFVKNSTNGVNNSITFVCTSNGSTAAQGFLSIRQYQSAGLTSSAGRLVWLNNAGTIVTP